MDKPSNSQVDDSMIQPAAVQLDPDKTYQWCGCGQSKTLPFCTTKPSNAESGSAGSCVNQSLAFSPNDAHTVWLCTCQHTKTPPYCDGSHNFINKPQNGFWGWLKRC